MLKSIERLQYILLRYREEIRENYPEYFETVDALLAGLNSNFLEWSIYMVQSQMELPFVKVSEMLDGLEQRKWITSKDKGNVWAVLLQNNLNFISTSPYSCISFRAFYDYNAMDEKEKQEYLNLGSLYYQKVHQGEEMDVYDFITNHMYFSDHKIWQKVSRFAMKFKIKRLVGDLTNYIEASEDNRRFFEDAYLWIAKMLESLDFRTIEQMLNELSKQGISDASLESIRGYFRRQVVKNNEKKEPEQFDKKNYSKPASKVSEPVVSEKEKKYAYHCMKEILNKVLMNRETKEIVQMISFEDYLCFLHYARILGPLDSIQNDIRLLSQSLRIDETCYAYLIEKAHYLSDTNEQVNELLIEIQAIYGNMENCSDPSMHSQFQNELQDSFSKLHLKLAKKCDYECNML